MGAAPRASLARALVCGKLFHFDINDGYRLKHDVDIAVGLVNPLDWLNVLVLLRSHNYNGPFNLDYKPPRTTSNHGVFAVSFPTALDRFITLWEMAGEVIADPIIKEATDALKAAAARGDPKDVELPCRGKSRVAVAARTDRSPVVPNPDRTASRAGVFRSRQVGMGRMLILGLGLLLVVWCIRDAGRAADLPFGRLPGDITYRGKNTTVYFPVVTCLLSAWCCRW